METNQASSEVLNWFTCTARAEPIAVGDVLRSIAACKSATSPTIAKVESGSARIRAPPG